MTHVYLQWTPTTPVTRIAAGYDRQRVERDAVGDGSWVALLRADQLMPLVATVEDYVFEDPSGSVDYDYRVVYVKSSDATEDPSPQAITDVTAFGYCTVDDIRDQGWALADVSDAMVAKGIAWATAYIERATGQWFLPRYRRLVLDGSGYDRLFLDIPPIALMQLLVDGSEQTVSDLDVYNRHLTRGLLAPDDRENPMIAYSSAYTVTDMTGLRPMAYGYSAFEEGGQIVQAVGIFGHTELAPGTQPGETSAGSGVPLSYGTVPPLIEWAAIHLTMQHMFPANSVLGDGGAAKRRVVGERTMDQSYTMASAKATTVGDAPWADEAAVREVLARYSAPQGVGAI